MRPLCVLLLVYVVSLPVLAQYGSEHDLETGIHDFYIPAELKKDLRAEKLHVGDEVRLETLEGVLAGHGFVLPGGTKLYGHVVETNAFSEGRLSDLEIVVQKAVWKSKTIPLHAFITGFGIRKKIFERPSGSSGCSSGNPSDGARIPPWQPDFPECISPPRNVSESGGLRGLTFRRNPADGSTWILAKRGNVHLPGGTLVLLHQIPEEPKK